MFRKVRRSQKVREKREKVRGGLKKSPPDLSDSVGGPSELRVFFILPEFVGVRRSPSESGALSNYAQKVRNGLNYRSGPLTVMLTAQDHKKRCDFFLGK